MSINYFKHEENSEELEVSEKQKIEDKENKRN
jgi:hypothetical protein